MGDQPPPMSDKATLRAWVRSRRRGLAAPLPTGTGQGFADAVLATPAVRGVLDDHPQSPVLVYVQARGEPPTDALRSHLRHSGTDVFVPWALPNRQMKWLPDDGSAQPWGLPGVGDPDDASSAVDGGVLTALQPSMLILPALAATQNGARLGQGGGYYDTMLTDCPAWSEGGPLRVALVWPWEVLEELPVDQHDQHVDLVVSYWS